MPLRESIFFFLISLAALIWLLDKLLWYLRYESRLERTERQWRDRYVHRESPRTDQQD